MNYGALYTALIEDRKANPPPPGMYTERHHIVPRFEGGSNDPENLIRLTARDHIFAHLILAKWKGGKHWLAVSYVSANSQRRTIPTAQEIRIAALGREKALKGNNLGSGKRSTETRMRISKARQGVKLSDEARSKLSQARKGSKLSAETRLKMSESRKGKTASAETRRKMSEVFQGRKHSLQARLKMSEAAIIREARRRI